MVEIAREARFPEYFGHNWDALLDCLTDPSWLPAGAYQIVWNRASELLIHAPQDFLTFLDVLSDAAGWWEERGVEFRITIVDDLISGLAGFLGQATVLE